MTNPQTPPELSNEDIDRVFKTIDIPTCPAIVMEVMAESQKDNPNLNKLAQAIASDVGMSAITLKMANSPLFRTRGNPVTSVRTSLDRLGMRNVVCVVVAAALHASLSGVQAAGFMEKFWDRTWVTAIGSGLIARRQYGVSPDAAYTYGLFHDIGIPLMLRRFPEYERMAEQCRQSGRLLIEAEHDYFPCTHPVIAAIMVRSWGLPQIVAQAIRFHHEPDVYDLPDRILPGGAVSLIAITHLAEHLACDLYGEEDLEVGDPLYQRALAHFGVSEEELEQWREDLAAAVQEARRQA